MNKEGSYRGIIIVMFVSLLIAFFWDSLGFVRDSVNYVLNPTFGALLQWNTLIGFLIIVAIISVIMTLMQKYLTDQAELKRMKKEQKEMQEKMKKLDRTSKEYQDLSIESIKLIGPMFKLSMRPLIYTSIPIILFFRWFQEILHPIYGGWWILYYILASMILGSILRKVLKVA